VHFRFFLSLILLFLSSSLLPEVVAETPDEMVQLKGGTFQMGTDDEGRDGESPARQVKVKPFAIDVTSVTNEQFLEFIRDTKYKSEAETFGWSFVLDMFVSKQVKKTVKDKLEGAEWWLPVEGAYWRQPFGPKSSIKDRMDHPVVHMSWNDAASYCKWKGKRLPTEAEWEFAARGGLKEKQYPWGNKYEANRMNIWQGKFPTKNTKEDGYAHTAPVTAFGPQNDYGVYNMVGNVWEWVNDKYKPSVEDNRPNRNEEKRVLRGGSYLDSINGKFNHRTRVTTRMGNTPDSGSDNLGFRCAKPIKAQKNSKSSHSKEEL